MPAQSFIVISVQTGPLEGGSIYRSMWVQPTEWEDRAAPHLTRGPVPMKIDCSEDAINSVLQSGQPLPSPFALDVGVKVAAGNKSKGYVFTAELIQAETQVEEPKVEEPKVDESKADEPKVDESKADEPKNEFMRKRA